MIQEFVDLYMERKEILRGVLKLKHPTCYSHLVAIVIKVINPNEDYGLPDPDRIHEIDDGDYQGTLVYIIGVTGYQPSKYWSVKVDYGSCSGCDTLEGIKSDGGYDELPNAEQVEDYLTFGLHIIQGMREIG